jgi:hypothetical protein
VSSAPITILPEQLERFARELGLTQAILTGWSPDGTMHVVTWGDSLTDSAQAAQGGNAIKRALGFPETLCRTLSPRVTEALALAEQVRAWLKRNGHRAFATRQAYDALRRLVDAEVSQ